MNPVAPMTPTDRERIFSIFSYLVGGWNASKGIHMGHLRSWDMEFDHDDEKLARHILDSYERCVTRDLREENLKLKARLYDLEHPR